MSDLMVNVRQARSLHDTSTSPKSLDSLFSIPYAAMGNFWCFRGKWRYHPLSAAPIHMHPHMQDSNYDRRLLRFLVNQLSCWSMSCSYMFEYDCNYNEHVQSLKWKERKRNTQINKFQGWKVPMISPNTHSYRLTNFSQKVKHIISVRQLSSLPYKIPGNGKCTASPGQTLWCVITCS